MRPEVVFLNVYLAAPSAASALRSSQKTLGSVRLATVEVGSVIARAPLFIVMFVPFLASQC